MTSLAPAEADWVRSKLVNTTEAAKRPKGCTMSTLDGWLRVICASSNLGGWVLTDGFGKAGADYFRSSQFVGQLNQLELPLKAGHSYKALVTEDLMGRASFEVSWPSGEPRPTRIALTTKR